MNIWQSLSKFLGQNEEVPQPKPATIKGDKAPVREKETAPAIEEPEPTEAAAEETEEALPAQGDSQKKDVILEMPEEGNDKENAEPAAAPVKPGKIFFVPSAKELLNKSCREFLAELSLDLVEIQYQEHYQRPVAEMVAEHRDVDFAVFLLSGEDLVYARDKKPTDAKLRVSQNNVFLLGYLLAKLGKKRTFIIYFEKENFLLPTDQLNAIYIPFNRAHGWKLILKHRLQECGLTSEPGPSKTDECAE